MRLKNKVAIITGASNGMGAAEARLFAEEGAKVVIADIEEDRGEVVASEIRTAGGTAVFKHLDVTKEEEWERLVDYTIQSLGAIGILVNNAGIANTAYSDQMSVDGWDKLMNINAKGVFLGMKSVIPEMVSAGGGSIVNISSVLGFVGAEKSHMGYHASKGAVRIATKSAAVQYAKQGVRVNSVHPGLMPPMQSSSKLIDGGMRDETRGQVPMGRSGRVEEVASAVLFLASDEASYITGTELVVDGGLIAV